VGPPHFHQMQSPPLAQAAADGLWLLE